MAPCTAHPPARGPHSRACRRFCARPACGGCNQEAKTEPPQPRPVRTVTVEKGVIGDSVQLTGDIRAENEVNLAFRIGGRIIERKGEVGDKVEPDQVLAKLDPQDELNTLRSAQAALTAAQAQAGRGAEQFRPPEPPDGARLHHARELRFGEAGACRRRRRGSTTRPRNWTSPRTGSASPSSKPMSRGRSPRDPPNRVRWCRRDSRSSPSRGQDGRDAVFDVPAQVLRAAPADATITIALANDPVGDREGARADGRAAGRSGHAHIPGEAQPDRSSRGDAPRRDGDRAPATRGRPTASRFRRAR